MPLVSQHSCITQIQHAWRALRIADRAPGVVDLDTDLGHRRQQHIQALVHPDNAHEITALMDLVAFVEQLVNRPDVKLELLDIKLQPGLHIV